MCTLSWDGEVSPSALDKWTQAIRGFSLMRDGPLGPVAILTWKEFESHDGWSQAAMDQAFGAREAATEEVKP
jgi:hypothetical protein